MSSRRSIGNTFYVTTVTDGQRGKAGRFYYFAGDWNSSTTYVMTDTQAPYVKASNGSFYMLDNAGNGGSNVNSTNQNPTNSSYGNGKPWTAMASDMKYYIAKAFFGEYAQFGSAIINGDWMLSTQGKRYGSSSSAYTAFDADDPLGVEDSSHFAPNFCVDLKTGACYMNQAYIKGNIFTPYFQLTADNISNYATNKYDSAGFYYYDIDLIKTGLNLQIKPTSGSVIYVSLPAESSYLGAEANILCENYYCVLRNIYRVSPSINSMGYTAHHPMVYAGQKLKLKCVYIGSAYRWVIDEMSDYYAPRQPLVLGMGETHLSHATGSYVVSFWEHWTYCGDGFTITRNSTGNYTVTCPASWQGALSSSTVIQVYGVGWVFDSDGDRVTGSPCKATLLERGSGYFKVATSDDYSLNDGEFGFVIYRYDRIGSYIV